MADQVPENTKAEPQAAVAETERDGPEPEQSENETPALPEPEHNEAEKTTSEPVAARRNTGRWIALATVVLLAGLAAAGYGGWLWIGQERERLQTELAGLTERIQQQQTDLQALRAALQETASGERQRAEGVAQSLSVVQQRLETHNKRLLSLSSTDRDDWRLAEAEYLLQLANQRLLIESDSRNAEQLLAAADNILLELQDVDLFVVREGINRDLTALKLTPKIDREGIYLRLAALAGQVANLEVVPDQPFAGGEVADQPQSPVEEPAAETGNWLQAVKQHFARALGKFTSYIRITHHREALQPILPPDSEAYLQQNLRFMLERAQLALMREEQTIYADSLRQARDWLGTYYRPANRPQDVVAHFDGELQALQQLEIAQPLPDISQSLEQLQAYIEKLHKLTPAPAPAPPPASGEVSE